MRTTRVSFRLVISFDIEPGEKRGDRLPPLCIYYGNVKNIMYSFKMIQNNTFKSLVTGTVMSIVTIAVLHNLPSLPYYLSEKCRILCTKH